MIASAVNPSYIPTDPLLLVPQHPMASTTTSPYFFGAGLAVSPQTARPLQSLYGGPSFDSIHASPASHAFSPLSLHHAQTMSNHSNDMMIDEPAPASPSSSNSTEQDDEESAALILHALESGSLSPRGSPQAQPLHAASRGYSGRQRKVTTISPMTPKRKRISSLTEIADTSSSAAGKESAYDDYDLSMHDTLAPASPPQHHHHQAHGHSHGHHHHHQHRGSLGSAGSTSWSLPSSNTGFTFAQNNYASQFGVAASPVRQQGLSASSSSTQPISIPRPKPSGAFGAYSPSHSHGSPHMTLSSTAPSSSSNKKMRRTPRARLENHQCPNCHTSDSPLWRNCLIKGKILHLCNSCGLRYKKHKYCPHCYKVYYDAETNVHDWTQCVQCHNWTHRQCLNDAGIDSGLPGTYKCLRCLGLLPDCD